MYLDNFWLWVHGCPDWMPHDLLVLWLLVGFLTALATSLPRRI